MPWDSARSGAPARGTAPLPGECHLWPVEITADSAWMRFLHPSERGQAERFLAPRARDTFVVSRALQRLIMSCYLGCAPDDLVIRRTCARCGSADHGRPSAGPGAPDYSVTHSGDWILVAVAGSGRVGADIEQGRRLADIAVLADGTLTPCERSEFDALPDNARQGWFYRMWTRKEAAAKTTDRGLAMIFASLDVRASKVAVPASDGGRAQFVQLRDLAAPEGYVAALASTDPVTTVRWCGPASPAPSS